MAVPTEVPPLCPECGGILEASNPACRMHGAFRVLCLICGEPKHAGPCPRLDDEEWWKGIVRREAYERCKFFDQLLRERGPRRRRAPDRGWLWLVVVAALVAAARFAAGVGK